MSLNLSTLFPARPFQEGRLQAAFSQVYSEALRSYFAGETSKALEQITDALIEYADAGSTAETFAGYRLWIELLADGNETNALKSLAQHLFVRAQAEPEAYMTLVGLRGMAHFEADEFQAASLLARTVDDAEDNAYCMELLQSVRSRLSNVEVPALAKVTQPITDYFHWQNLARALLIAKEDEGLAEVLGYVAKAFKASPLPATYEFHRCIDSGFFAAAALVATKLCDLYPANTDYQYFHAYALFEDGDYPSARKILLKAVQAQGETDAEIVGLLGHCYAKVGEAEKASYFLKRAISLLQDEGLPTSHIRLELANVEDELRGDQLDPALEMPRSTRMWLIKLSPRRYNELRVSSESTVDRLLRPMGNAPRPGDFCFFAGESTANQKGESQWKIAAIYTVDSEPIWHPVHEYHTSLQLVARPPEGIPVSVQLMAEKEGEQNAEEFAAYHPYNYGVFELEMGALDIITEAVKRRNDELVGRGERGDERSKDRSRSGRAG